MFGLSFAQLAIAVVIVAAILAVVFVVLRKLDMMPPEWAQHIIWILILALVAVIAILLLVQLWAAAGHS